MATKKKEASAAPKKTETKPETKPFDGRPSVRELTLPPFLKLRKLNLNGDDIRNESDGDEIDITIEKAVPSPKKDYNSAIILGTLNNDVLGFEAGTRVGIPAQAAIANTVLERSDGGKTDKNSPLKAELVGARLRIRKSHMQTTRAEYDNADGKKQHAIYTIAVLE